MMILIIFIARMPFLELTLDNADPLYAWRTKTQLIAVYKHSISINLQQVNNNCLQQNPGTNLHL